MLLKGLYEALTSSLYESRIQRTIDKKLWLTVASICSRNKSTDCEFIKPLSKMDKNELLNRYVAALLIMKKQCPANEQEIETLKTFKLLGKRYLELGGTIDEITNLYVANGGKGVVQAVPVNNNVINKLESEVKTDPEEQGIQILENPADYDKEENTEADEIIEELPDGVNDYDVIFKYVKHKFNNLSDICKSIYEILE